MQSQKVKKIVSICPHCVRTIQTDWKDFGVSPEIEHHSEFIARHQHLLPSNKSSEKIAYHDPCYLGRYRDVYDQPRSIVSASGNLVEPERSRERSFCCGAGGGLAFLGEEDGQRVSGVRAQQLAATGATTVAAACPFCNTMLRDAFSGTENAPQLLDIAQIAAAQLPQTQTTLSS